MTPLNEYSGATARCRCPLTCPVCVPDACPRFLRPPRGFRDSSARVQIPKRSRALIPRSGVSPASAFRTSCRRFDGAKEDPHPAFIAAHPLSTFSPFPLRNSRAALRRTDIDDGTAACFGSEKYFRCHRRRTVILGSDGFVL
jgi:hypothetical protein